MSQSLQAPPILGANLLAAAKAHDDRRPLPASSGSAVIDEAALDGGFRYGEITSLAGISGTGKTLLTYHAIASHLLVYEQGEVALIDTTGSFSPLRLLDVLAFRLEARLPRDRIQHSQYMYEKAHSKERGSRDELIEQATTMLDRVKVMRVFDFAGVVEAVGEIRQTREKSSQKADISESAKAGRKNQVYDSEEEPDDDIVPPLKSTSDNDRGSDRTIGMVIIDAVTNVISSMMSKSQVHGQAFLASFMRSFCQLTNRYKICTIMINAVVGLNPTKNPDYQRRPDEHVSIFSSTLGKPALGKSFTYLVDTSIFISAVPKTSKDAAIAFGDHPDSPFGKALIIEVNKDRCGAREGRWAAFAIVDGVKLATCAG